MSMPDAPSRVLFVFSSLDDPHRPDSRSMNLYEFYDSYAASGLGMCAVAHGDVRSITIDDDAQHVAREWRTDDDVVEFCRWFTPDLLVLCEIAAPVIDGQSLVRNLHLTNLHPLVLAYIRHVLKIPIVYLCHDTSSDDFPRLERRYPMVDLSVVLDHKPYAPYTRQPERYCHLWIPWDTRVVHDAGLDRIIDVSFSGRIGMARYEYRRRLLDELERDGIVVWRRPATDDAMSYLPYTEYIRVLQTSKITINGSSSGQLKGRVFEALHCGALLMEPEGTLISLYFRPDVDCVIYHDSADLAEKIRYYLTHDAEREQIAQSGHARAVSLYGPAQWWRRVWELVRELVEPQRQEPLRFVG